MTQQEIIKAAKTNWLAWQGLKELQPEVAAWMRDKLTSLIWRDDEEWIEVKLSHNMHESFVYRLRPDYKSDQFWFDPVDKLIHTGDKLYLQWLEVTAEYADYLHNKPDGEWELRKPKGGDDCCGIGWVRGICRDESYGDDCGPTDRGYRWCKPKAPAYGWREYAVVERKGSYIIDGYGNATSGLNLYKAAGRVGFGGVQFKGQNTWCALVAAYENDGGLHMFSHDYDSKLATPIKCRFWEAQQ